MRIDPRCGTSRPATARSSVVLPLPDGPSSDTTPPWSRRIDTPFRMALSPYARCRSSTASFTLAVRAAADAVDAGVASVSVMQVHSEAQRHGEADGHQHHVDERESGDHVGPA